MKSKPAVLSPQDTIWPNVILVLLGGAMILRLVIWKFLRSTEILFREEFANAAVAAVIMLIAVIWSTLKLVRREPFRRTGFELPIALLLGAAGCSLVYTADFPLSLNSVLVLGAEVAFFYMLVDVLNTSRRIRWTLFFFLAVALVVAGYGVREFFYLWTQPFSPTDAQLSRMNDSLYYILENRRVVSFLGWPNSLAGYLLLILPLLLVLPFRLKSVWQKTVVVVTWPVFLACFLFTFSFLGWTSLILATLALLPLFWTKLRINGWSRERKAILLGAVLVFCGLFVWVIFRKNFIGSLMPRIFYYQESLALLLQKPLEGHGWGTFGIMCRQFAPERAGLSAYAHNSYLQVWVESGLVGFAGILLLVATFFRMSRKTLDVLGQGKNMLVFLALVWGLTAFFIDNLFSFTMLKPNIALYGWTILAVFCAFVRHIQNPDLPQGSFWPRVHAAFVLAACALSLVILLRLVGGYLCYYQAKYTKKSNVYEHALKWMARADAWDSWSSYLAAGAGDLRMRAFAASNQARFVKEAEGYYLEAIRRSPHVHVNYFILGGIYMTLGNPREASVFYTRAKELSPVEFRQDMAILQKRQEAVRKQQKPVPEQPKN